MLRSRLRQHGVTLVELMVSITIGMLIVAAMSLLFANNSRTRTELMRSAQKIENGRYALEVLSADLQNAGYYAEFDPRAVPVPGSVPDPCDTGAANLAAALPLAVQGFDNVAAATVSCLSDVKVGTDVLVVRRASGCVAGVGDCRALAANDYRFQAASCNSGTQLGSASPSNHFRLDTAAASMTLTKLDCATPAPVRRFVVHIYYVANNDRAGDGVPTLKVAELAGGGTFNVRALARGIENVQFEYGLDTSTTGDGGAPVVYTAAPEGYLGACAGAACAGRWASVTAVKAFVLSRGDDPSGGYTDNKTYQLGQLPDGSSGESQSPKVVGPVGDGFKRNVVLGTTRLNNVSGRNATRTTS